MFKQGCLRCCYKPDFGFIVRYAVPSDSVTFASVTFTVANVEMTRLCPESIVAEMYAENVSFPQALATENIPRTFINSKPVFWKQTVCGCIGYEVNLKKLVHISK